MSLSLIKIRFTESVYIQKNSVFSNRLIKKQNQGGKTARFKNNGVESFAKRFSQREQNIALNRDRGLINQG